MKIFLNKVNANTKLNQNFIQKPFSQPQNGDFTMQNCHLLDKTANSTPAYFHPPFCGITEISKLSKFLDDVVANPHNLELINQSKKFDLDVIFHSRLNAKNSLGDGRFSWVFKLDDKYVVKFPKNESFDLRKFEVNDDNRFKKLTKWYGETIAWVGNTRILKNANPVGAKATPAGVPEWEKYSLTTEKKYIEKCANLPQKAFDDVAENLKILNGIKNPDDPKRSYFFDPKNPNNFLLSDYDIKIVDDLEFLYGDDFNDLGLMLTPLIAKSQTNKPAEFVKELIEPRRIILKNCLSACEKNKLPMPYDFIDGVTHSFMLIDKKGKWYLVKNKIKELRTQIPDNHEERAELLVKYFDQL